MALQGFSNSHVFAQAVLDNTILISISVPACVYPHIKRYVYTCGRALFVRLRVGLQRGMPKTNNWP